MNIFKTPGSLSWAAFLKMGARHENSPNNVFTFKASKSLIIYSINITSPFLQLPIFYHI